MTIRYLVMSKNAGWITLLIYEVMKVLFINSQRHYLRMIIFPSKVTDFITRTINKPVATSELLKHLKY
jgi:hypothetical protein